MSRLDGRLWLGILLVVGGIVFLFQNIGLISFANWVWAVLLGAAGLAFLAVVYRDRRNWWAIIPGLILAYLAILMIFDQFFPASSSDFGGALFLAIIGVSFLFVYLLNRQGWWAILPAGTLLTLAIVAGLSRFLSGMVTGGVFFLGLGLTFLVLYFLDIPTGRMRWPLIPGGILLLMGVLLSLSATGILNVLWPVGLILLGILLFLFRLPFRRS